MVGKTRWTTVPGGLYPCLGRGTLLGLRGQSRFRDIKSWSPAAQILNIRLVVPSKHQVVQEERALFFRGDFTFELTLWCGRKSTHLGAREPVFSLFYLLTCSIAWEHITKLLWPSLYISIEMLCKIIATYHNFITSLSLKRSMKEFCKVSNFFQNMKIFFLLFIWARTFGCSVLNVHLIFPHPE